MSMMNGPDNQSLPFSEACERNKQPILAVLREYLPLSGAVLEIGSGTGQHAVYFAANLPQLIWHPSDTGSYLPGLRARMAAEGPANVAEVAEVDVRRNNLRSGEYAAVFSANTLHFMSEAAGESFFSTVDRVVPAGGVLVVYGPFRYAGRFTSASNERFDQWLKSTDRERGVRDFEWVNGLAAQAQLELVADVAMPANNQCLVWRKSTSV